MELKLIRTEFSSVATIGELYADGVFQCYTLEDVVRPDGAPKVHGKTAIPVGKYKVIVTQSFRFKRLLPLLVDVPGFEGIRIHPGNTSENTEGCLLVGTTKSPPNFIGNSRTAFASLFALLGTAKNGITIAIQNGR